MRPHILQSSVVAEAATTTATPVPPSVPAPPEAHLKLTQQLPLTRRDRGSQGFGDSSERRETSAAIPSKSLLCSVALRAPGHNIQTPDVQRRAKSFEDQDYHYHHCHHRHYHSLGGAEKKGNCGMFLLWLQMIPRQCVCSLKLFADGDSSGSPL